MKEHGALQDEALGVARSTDPVEQTLECEAGEHQLETLTSRFREGQQLGAHRSTDVFELSNH